MKSKKDLTKKKDLKKNKKLTRSAAMEKKGGGEVVCFWIKKKRLCTK